MKETSEDETEHKNNYYNIDLRSIFDWISWYDVRERALMKDKNWGIFFLIFAVVYFIFTTYIVKHGIHFTNSILTIGLLLTGGYYLIKSRKNN